MTLEELMKQGGELFSRHVFPSEPDWESLHDETPEDGEPGEADATPDEDVEDLLSNSRDEILAAISADLHPLGRALDSAMQEGDVFAMRAALESISRRAPEFFSDANLSETLLAEFTAAMSATDDEP